MNHHEHDPELIECRECATTFDLARQQYHDNLCPSCVDEEWTYLSCTICGDRHPRDEMQVVRMHTRTSTESVPVCSAGCADHASTPPWSQAQRLPKRKGKFAEAEE